ncbi:MAG: 50S ribosomal protein L18 [Candidatus Pacearchaeota archaeon]
MSRLRIAKRRRRESKTDYKNRLTLLKSNKTRIAVRITNNYLTIQSIESINAQDKVIKTVSSRDLIKYGWDKKFIGSLKSISACYLTGLLFASQVDPKKDYIMDFGMNRLVKGNRFYASLKGLIDGKLKIPHGEDIFPSLDRLNGKHQKPEIQKMIKEIKSKVGVKNE